MKTYHQFLEKASVESRLEKYNKQKEKEAELNFLENLEWKDDLFLI